MHGNVWEWVADCWQEHLGTDPQTDPTGPASCTKRTIRGGSYYNYASMSRSAYRAANGVNIRSRTIGFRVAMTP